MTEYGDGRNREGSGGAPQKISVGIASKDPGPTRALLEGFCTALSASTQLKVTGIGVGHYGRLIEALDRGEVDVAWLPPILAFQATARGLIRPVALPVRRGFSCYSTALFTREASPIHTTAELSGAKAAWVDRQSAAGYLIIRAHLRSIGIDLSRAFGSDLFMGSHDVVSRAVLQGDADVGATYAYLDPRSLTLGGSATAVHAPWGTSKVRVLAHAGPIPSDVIAVGSRITLSIEKLLQRALVYGQHPGLRQAASALFGAEGFIAPQPEHLRPLSTLLSGLEGASEEPVSLASPSHR